MFRRVLISVFTFFSVTFLTSCTSKIEKHEKISAIGTAISSKLTFIDEKSKYVFERKRTNGDVDGIDLVLSVKYTEITFLIDSILSGKPYDSLKVLCILPNSSVEIGKQYYLNAERGNFFLRDSTRECLRPDSFFIIDPQDIEEVAFIKGYPFDTKTLSPKRKTFIQ